MADQTPTPRLGAALIIGADAAICVHVHTDRDGIAAISARLHELDAAPGAASTVPVVSVVGTLGEGVAAIDEFAISPDAVDDLAAMALGVNR